MGQFLSRLHLNPSIEDLSDEDFQEHILSFIVSNDIIKEEIEAFSVPRRTRKRRKVALLSLTPLRERCWTILRLQILIHFGERSFVEDLEYPLLFSKTF